LTPFFVLGFFAAWGLAAMVFLGAVAFTVFTILGIWTILLNLQTGKVYAQDAEESDSKAAEVHRFRPAWHP
jgi:hypothetical protein